jgi:GPI mannosyltransferase 1 subunit M
LIPLPKAESLAFIPQLLLSTFLIPLVLAKKDLATSMLAQTFAFVTFNKVCTSQYFLWYLVLLPLYLPISSFTKHPKLGLRALGLWAGAQALWLQQGYQLEFLGRSTFFPGLWLSSLVFFGVSCWILTIIVADCAGLNGDDVGVWPAGQGSSEEVKGRGKSNSGGGKPKTALE